MKIMMKNRAIIGITLMITSFFLLVLWEVKGREMLLFTPVLAASQDIPNGTVINSSHIKQIRVLPENIVEDALDLGQSEILIGQQAKTDLLKNQQLSASQFQRYENRRQPDSSVFVIPEHWIVSMSTVVRPGDTVCLLSATDGIMLGAYDVAYVSDKNGRISGEYVSHNEDLLKRQDGAYSASSLEILCTPAEYIALYQQLHASNGKNLIIYVEGEQ